MKVSCTNDYSIGVCLYIILFLPGEFIVNIANAIIAWLLTSLSEFTTCSTTYASFFRSTLRRETRIPQVMNGGLMDQTFAAWSLNEFSTAYCFRTCPVFTLTHILVPAFSSVKAHPHPIHIIFWSIFFGPIIILMPCLLVLEIIILVR